MVTWLESALGARVPFAFGELAVEPCGEGWIVRGPSSAASPSQVDASSETIRLHVRFDGRTRYRPLSGARTLPGGWFTELSGNAALVEVLEVIYPLATRHITQAGRGPLRTVPLADVLTRQSGRYEESAGLSAGGRNAAVEVLCDRCVRTPAWEGPPLEHGSIPCPEACSVLVSFCREAALWEQAPPEPAPPDPAVGFADFERPGNELREAWLARRYANLPQGAH